MPPRFALSIVVSVSVLAIGTLPVRAQSRSTLSRLAFGPVGIVNGVDGVRVNVVLQPPPEGDCALVVSFLDAEGIVIQTVPLLLRGETVGVAEFGRDLNQRTGAKMPLRAVVAESDAGGSPGCDGVQATFEVLDRAPTASCSASARVIPTSRTTSS